MCCNPVEPDDQPFGLSGIVYLSLHLNIVPHISRETRAKVIIPLIIIYYCTASTRTSA